MGIEVKGIKYNENGVLLAKLYVDGKRAADIENLMYHSGISNTYYPYGTNGDDLLESAKDYCKTLPPYNLSLEGELKLVPMDLEVFVKRAVIEHAEKQSNIKFEKGKEKDMKSAIIYGKDGEYRLLKLPCTIKEIFATEGASDILAEKIKKLVLPEMKDTDKILNTNLPASFFEKHGLGKVKEVSKDEKIQDKETPDGQDAKPTRRKGR